MNFASFHVTQLERMKGQKDQFKPGLLPVRGSLISHQKDASGPALQAGQEPTPGEVRGLRNWDVGKGLTKIDKTEKINFFCLIL